RWADGAAPYLDFPHRPAGCARDPKGAVELEVEGDGQGAFPGQGEVLVLAGPQLEVVGTQALAGHLHPTPLLEGALDGVPVDLGQSPLELVDPGPQTRPEGAEVGDDRPG